MSSAGKARKQDAAQEPVWTEAQKDGAVVTPVTPVREDDAIGEMLGETASPVPPRRWRPTWRQFRGALILVPLIGIAIPAHFWLQYQSQNVTSKNAAVRGHLAEIGTRLSGQVSAVEVDVGDRVEAGQLLVQLADRHLVADVQEASAEVAGLQQTIEVERLEIAHERRAVEQGALEVRARVEAAEAQASAAQIEAENARRNYELRESLFSRDGAISSEDVLNAKAETRQAEARFEEAQANAVAARSAVQGIELAQEALTIREQKIGVLEADMRRAEAQLARAEADMEGAAIRAPEDGAIVRRIIQPGGSVEVGQPIISMWLGDDVWVEAWVEEEDIGFVRLGHKATVTFHSFPGQEFRGVVDKIGLATDLELPDSEVPQPRFSRMRGAPVVGVRIRLDDPPIDLLPGLSAVVAIEKTE